MKRLDRRSALNTAAAMGIGGVAGCALPGRAAPSPATPFEVAET